MTLYLRRTNGSALRTSALKPSSVGVKTKMFQPTIHPATMATTNATNATQPYGMKSAPPAGPFSVEVATKNVAWPIRRLSLIQ